MGLRHIKGNCRSIAIAPQSAPLHLCARVQAVFWRINLAVMTCLIGIIFAAHGMAMQSANPSVASDYARILNVRFGPDGDKTRIVMDISGTPNFEVLGNRGADGKGRLVIDFANIPGAFDESKTVTAKGHIAHYRHGSNAQAQARYIFTFKRSARIGNIFVLDPTTSVRHYRLVIDLYRSNLVEYLASLPRVENDLGFVVRTPALIPIIVANITKAPRLKPRNPSGNSATDTTQIARQNGQEFLKLEAPSAAALNPDIDDDMGPFLEEPPAGFSTNRAPNLASDRAPDSDIRISSASGALPTTRTVADLIERETRNRQNTAQNAKNRPNETRKKSKTANAATDKKITIVIDPGHGGSHPGAVGQLGTLEKDVNLAAAKILSKKLVKTGRYRVVMTRNDDRKVELDQRAQIARDVGANLFISLHADGNDDHTLRGSSVYTLSEEGTKRSLETFDKDLAEFSSDLGPILFDVVQKKTKTESSQFAGLLIKRLKPVTILVKNAQRSEDLKVLLRPDVPAVLLEMAFISNLDDETNLTNEVWRNKSMQAVVAAIDDYFYKSSLSLHAARTRAAPAKAGGL